MRAEKDFALPQSLTIRQSDRKYSIIRLLIPFFRVAWAKLSFKIALKWMTRFHLFGLWSLILYFLLRYLNSLNFSSFGSFFPSTSAFSLALSILFFLLKIILSLKIYDSQINIDTRFKNFITLEAIMNPLGIILMRYALFSLPIQVWEKKIEKESLLSTAFGNYLQRYSFPEVSQTKKLLLLTNLSFSYSFVPNFLLRLYKKIISLERFHSLCLFFFSPKYLAEKGLEEPTKLIKGLNVSFFSQRFIAIVGRNGSGKSTIAKIIVGLLVNYEGNVFWVGRELAEFSIKTFAKHISYIPQHSIIYHDISLVEFIAAGFAPSEGLLLKKLTKAEKERKVRKMLQELGMEREEHKSLASLSGGNKQKAIIARAIVQGTKIIILDEPLNFLDIKSRILVLDYLKFLQKKHKVSIIMIHHDIEQVREYLDEIVIIDSGYLEAHIRL